MQLFLFMRINLEKLHNGPLNKLKGIVSLKVCMYSFFLSSLQIYFFLIK